MSIFPFLLCACVLALEAPAGGYGPIHLPINFYPRCPVEYGAVCRSDIDPVARIVRLEIGDPRWERGLCLDLSGMSRALVVFDKQDVESRTFSTAYGTSDRVDIGPEVIRLPFEHMSQIRDLPLADQAVSPLCQGLLPLNAHSPLWLFWPNATVSLAGVLLGDSHREMGRLVDYESPVLECERHARGLCVTRARVEGVDYRVVFDSGTQYTIVPPDLYDTLITRRTFDPNGTRGSTKLIFDFPPEPVDTDDCLVRYHELGFSTASRCGDGRGQFRLELPLEEHFGEKEPGPHEMLLHPGSDEDTIWMGVNVWKHLRMHVNNHRGEMVLHRHQTDGNMTTTRAILVFFMVFFVVFNGLADTHLVWLHSHEVTATVIITLTNEFATMALAGYGLHASSTVRAFEDSAAWVYPSVIAVVWTMIGFAFFVILAFVFEMALHHRSIVYRAINYHPRLPSEFHATERVMLARKFLISTAGFLGLWLLLLQRRHDNLGDGLALVASMFLYFSQAMFFARVIVLEYHSLLVNTVRRYSDWVFAWAAFLIVAVATSIYCVVVTMMLTVYPYLEHTLDTSRAVVLYASVGVFAITIIAVAFFLDYIVMRFLENYKDTLEHTKANAESGTQKARLVRTRPKR